MYVGIDLNVKLVNATKESPAKASAVKYLTRVQRNREVFLDQCAQQLEPEVSRE